MWHDSVIEMIGEEEGEGVIVIVAIGAVVVMIVGVADHHAVAMIVVVAVTIVIITIVDLLLAIIEVGAVRAVAVHRDTAVVVRRRGVTIMTMIVLVTRIRLAVAAVVRMEDTEDAVVRPIVTRTVVVEIGTVGIVPKIIWREGGRRFERRLLMERSGVF